MSSDVDNIPGCNPVDVNQEDTVVIDIDHGKTCFSQKENTSEEANASPDVEEIKVTRSEISIPHIEVEEVSNIVGTSNLAYSTDSVDSLPIIVDLNDYCNRYRYSVAIDTLDESEGIAYSESFAGPSTSTSSLERACSCNCHVKSISATDDVFDSSKFCSLKATSVVHYDENCNGISCPFQKHKKRRMDNLKINIGNVTNSPNITPTNTPGIFRCLPDSPNATPSSTPGRFRRMIPSSIKKMLDSSGNSPVSDKAPPNYRSLIFSIIQDEPPKYEDVTGEKLADELVDISQNVPANNGQARLRPSLKKRFIGIGTFMIIVTVTVLLLYLSAAVLESEKKLDGSISKSNRTA